MGEVIMTTEIKDKVTGKTIITTKPIDPELIPLPRAGTAYPKWRDAVRDFLASGDSCAEISGGESGLKTAVGLRNAISAQRVRVKVVQRRDRVFLKREEES